LTSHLKNDKIENAKRFEQTQLQYSDRGMRVMKYTLKNDELTVEFNALGGQLTSIMNSTGIEYLWQGDKTYWGGQAPVLFPIVGSLRNKKASIGGDKICCMERHGLVRKLEFEMIDRTKDSITFAICSNSKTRERYPYDFQLIIKYILNENSITTKYEVVNKNNEEMPFQIGGHPGFNCPLENSERFEDYVVEFEQTETADCPTPVPSTGLLDVSQRTRVIDNSNTLKMDHNLFKIDALVFDQLKSRKATLYNPKTRMGVQISFSDFDYLMVWSSANDGPFVALEPWSGLSTSSDENDVFEEKQGVHFLPSGQSDSVSFTITIL
jgi:galactose mutarotase-like enzyme